MSIDLGPVSRPPKSRCVLDAALCAAAPSSRQSYARRSGSSARLNENIPTVVSRSPNGSPMRVACDMSDVRDGNLAAMLPDWTRFEGAEEWLPAHARVAQLELGNFNRLFDQFFDRHLAARQKRPAALPQGDRDRLFQEFPQ